ncbi:serine protease inhibitor 42Dd-like [Drosophila elegans]|uniref:serine protease inhibitor 42Dd-like n=1 Tax=Drosophila elegans TaxID=30023 RepID=UPI0007E8A2B9|nr:serine protease inhibitor 42Dd-like [Drosophila elegans]
MPKIVWSVLCLLYFIANEVSPKKFTTLELASKIILELSDTNIIISPTAIDVALAQIYLGAAGETEAELKDVLGYPGSTKAEVLAALQRRSPEIIISSRMYVASGIPILPNYQQMSRKYLHVEAGNVDLSFQGAHTINSWVSGKTKGRVVDLIDSSLLDDATKVILVNVVIFQARWKYPIKKVSTGNFYLPDERRSVAVKMLDHVGTFYYNFQDELDAHVAVIPFANSSLSMALIVPKTFRGIRKVEDNLKSLNLDALSLKELQISLPKFKIKYDQDLAQPLIDLGVKSIFNNANLSDLTKSKDKLKIDSIQHSAVLEVDEKGSKWAAAADDEILAGRSRSAGLLVTCNRPFLFAVVEGKKIFIFGRLSRPE